jgi:hypothetical protein
MKMKKWALFLMIAAPMIFAAPVHAKELSGVNFPDQRTVAGQPLVLNGLGLRQATAFKVSVYVAALYVAAPTSDADSILNSNSPKEISLRFVRGVGAGDLNHAWDEGFAKNAANEVPALRERIEKLKALMTDMKNGDELTFTSRPGEGVEVTINGAVRGLIEGDDFSKAMFSLWLGSNPPNAGLKTGLLGR